MGVEAIGAAKFACRAAAGMSVTDCFRSSFCSSGISDGAAAPVCCLATCRNRCERGGGAGGGGGGGGCSAIAYGEDGDGPIFLFY